ncbi:glycoside hydrolase superfamily [Protomyces lactucae-debilis]|uniref:Glycoside hydrolase superfamily n=1 Tax=Protomyces lactucae-debilis TaxID=2754530 RepID=A0A1Y2FP62_PROLT|nr:glycoside hydrolase superfamily [Protomyces lactucae-debilis]ORY84505.1 glycoside hydrolase superfamily [Protomyces lactucae-debilis]
MRVLTIKGQNFIDEQGRSVQLRGINLSGDSKLPKSPDLPSHQLEHFWDADNISFVGRPFELAEADAHLSRIRGWGYNIVRFVVTWEAVEHERPGKYDEAYIDYLIQVLRKCGQHGLYVLMDPHQDVWSRFSGGSGAPLWTLIAAGMNPLNFEVTEAALVHNTSKVPEAFPKMIWATNYQRLAAETMFTLFFAGRHFAPNAILDDQNIQDYLQNHFISAMQHVARRIVDAGDLAGNVVIGWESLNEPNRGLVGLPDLSCVEKEQHNRRGTCPTPMQSFATGAGFAQTIDVWAFGSMGAKKSGTTVVDPQGTSVWLDKNYDDSRYGWKRHAKWQLGRCIWAQHGVWSETDVRLLKPDYFSRGPGGVKLNMAQFLQLFWLDHFRAYKSAIREVHEMAIIFCQPPVLEVPPIFSKKDQADTQIVYAPHYYDGLTLMNKKWNTWYNVDVLGVLRGKYLSPVFAVKFGLRAIRNCLRDQLKAIRQEGLANLGNYPCFFTEIGVPYDMDGGRAYEDDDFSSQIGALDANSFALEGANAHFTLWQYSPLNTNRWGDHWNGEDLSLWSNSYVQDAALRPSSSSSEGSLKRKYLKALPEPSFPATELRDSGSRAWPAFLRPSPVTTAGSVQSFGFDLHNKVFSLVIEANQDGGASDIYVPLAHFDEEMVVEQSSGSTTFDVARQVLTWTHGPGNQRLHITAANGRGHSSGLFCSCG